MCKHKRLLIHKKLFANFIQLFQQVVEFMGDQVSDHGTTLGCIKDILLWSVLVRRTEEVVTGLQGENIQSL